MKSRVMEPYWGYEDVGVFFFVLVLLAATVRIAARVHLLRSEAVITPRMALHVSVIVFLSMALYVILKWRYRRPVIAPLGWILPNGFYVSLGFLGGIAAALAIASLAHLRHRVMLSMPTLEFLVLGLFLG